MTIIYKLVGTVNNGSKCKNEIEDKDFDKSTIQLSDVSNFFNKLGLEDCQNVKIIIDIEKELMIPDKEYSIESDKNRLIYIFSMDPEVKKKLISIFTKEISNIESKVLEKPLPFSEVKINDNIIQKSNTETVELFKDDDFLRLLYVYKNNPNMFKIFSSYITSGNVIIDKEKFSDSEKTDFSEELEVIKKLDIGVSDDNILETLKRFNGHLNLSLRFLLFNLDIENK